MKFFKPRCALGLHISAPTIYMVVLSRDWRGKLVTKKVKKNLPLAVFGDGKILNFQLLKESLRACILELGLTKYRAIISLPLHLAYLRHLSVPVGLTRKQVRRQIQLELENFNVECLYDYYRKPSSIRHYQSLEMVATRKAYALEYFNALKSAGLNVCAMDIDLIVLTHYLIEKFKLSKEKLVILFVMDKASILLKVCDAVIKVMHAWYMDSNFDNTIYIENYLKQYGSFQIYECYLTVNSIWDFGFKKFDSLLVENDYLIAAALAWRGLGYVL